MRVAWSFAKEWRPSSSGLWVISSGVLVSLEGGWFSVSWQPITSGDSYVCRKIRFANGIGEGMGWALSASTRSSVYKNKDSTMYTHSHTPFSKKSQKMPHSFIRARYGASVMISKFDLSGTFLCCTMIEVLCFIRPWYIPRMTESLVVLWRSKPSTVNISVSFLFHQWPLLLRKLTRD